MGTAQGGFRADKHTVVDWGMWKMLTNGKPGRLQLDPVVWHLRKAHLDWVCEDHEVMESQQGSSICWLNSIAIEFGHLQLKHVKNSGKSYGMVQSLAGSFHNGMIYKQ